MLLHIKSLINHTVANFVFILLLICACFAINLSGVARASRIIHKRLVTSVIGTTLRYNHILLSVEPLCNAYVDGSIPHLLHVWSRDVLKTFAMVCNIQRYSKEICITSHLDSWRSTRADVMGYNKDVSDNGCQISGGYCPHPCIPTSRCICWPTWSLVWKHLYQRLDTGQRVKPPWFLLNEVSLSATPCKAWNV